jgi:hypothetical protein
MGFLDRLLGREEKQYSQPSSPRRPAAPQRSDDEIAVERYQYLLRTAPPETIEKVHLEAFSKLTPEQRDLLFRQLSENASPSERPENAEPAILAKAATRAELQQPGTLARSFGGQGQGGMGFGGMVGSSLLGSVAGYVIGSALVSSFMPMDGGADAGSGSDNGGDAGSDAGNDATASGADASAADSGGDFGGGFGDFGGGGDFGF